MSLPELGIAYKIQTTVSGIWTAVAPTGFLPVPDSFIQATDIGGGLNRWDFNVSPIGGNDTTTASGILFKYDVDKQEIWIDGLAAKRRLLAHGNFVRARRRSVAVAISRTTAKFLLEPP